MPKKPKLIKLQPKFDIGDNCFYLSAHVIMKSQIVEISAVVHRTRKNGTIENETDDTVEWNYKMEHVTHWMTEKCLFLTPEDVADSMVYAYYEELENAEES
jgi:hypothetical protein